MIDLERRLVAGPLEIRTSWNNEETARLALKVLLRRRRRFLLRSVASLLSCVVLVIAALWASRIFPLEGSASQNGGSP
jgi:hypothetical protein